MQSDKTYSTVTKYDKIDVNPLKMRPILLLTFLSILFRQCKSGVLCDFERNCEGWQFSTDVLPDQEFLHGNQEIEKLKNESGTFKVVSGVQSGGEHGHYAKWTLAAPSEDKPRHAKVFAVMQSPFFLAAAPDCRLSLDYQLHGTRVSMFVAASLKPVAGGNDGYHQILQSYQPDGKVYEFPPVTLAEIHPQRQLDTGLVVLFVGGGFNLNAG